MSKMPTEPMSEGALQYWRGEVAHRAEGWADWPDGEVMLLVARFLATLDALPPKTAFPSDAEIRFNPSLGD